MQKIKLIFLLCVCLLPGWFLQAQEETAKTTFGSFMRSTGRSYVVIAVMLTILTGLILYLVRLERKISKIEKEN